MGKKAKREQAAKVGTAEIRIETPKPKPEPKPAKPKPAKEKKTPSDEQLYEALVKAYKDKPLSSREISDAAGISDPEVGRQAVRSAMKRLIAAGKVEAVKPEEGRPKQLYKPKT